MATDISPAQRAHQEIDYGRRGKPVYVFGALKPATGEVFTTTYPARTVLNWVTFLEAVEEWIPQDIGRVYAVLDNLNVHRAWDVLLFSLVHPRRRSFIPWLVKGWFIWYVLVLWGGVWRNHGI